MRDVKDEDADNDAEKRRYPMRAAEEPHVERIETVPDTAPDHDETDRDAHVASEIAQWMPLEILPLVFHRNILSHGNAC